MTYSFVILLLTGTFLALWFKPSMTEVVYHGSYVKLDGVHMSEAYVRITQGVLQSIPVVGTYLSFFLFGGEYPGNDIVPRMYILHVGGDRGTHRPLAHVRGGQPRARPRPRQHVR